MVFNLEMSSMAPHSKLAPALMQAKLEDVH
jgi:hypothetical protein